MAEQNLEYEQYAPQTGGRLFSNAMFGFNKEEVLEYLEELADENYQRQEAAEMQIQELTKRIRNFETTMANQPSAPSAEQSTELKALRRQLEEASQGLDIAKTATQQAEEELQQFREDLHNARQENAWLRDEFQKSDNQIADLRRQLEAATSGQWNEVQEAQDQIAELHRQLEEAQEAHEENAELRRQLEEALAENEAWVEEEDGLDGARQTATDIIAEANAEADRIRDEARGDRERIHRQLRNSAGGLAESIANLREDISGVEGEVGSVLESMQMALSDILAALGRTEQNLNTLGVQIDRFPASAPPVPRPQQVVYFQPSPQQPAKPAPRATSRPAANRPTGQGSYSGSSGQWYGNNGFQRVWPESSERRTGGDRRSTPNTSNLRSFSPSFTSTSQQLAYQQQPEEVYVPQEDTDERLRALTDTLVDTLRQLME